MKTDEVPQDPDSAHAGQKKLLYAVDDNGQYRAVGSQGWETEAYATTLAVQELERLEAEALEAWQAGRVSVIQYLMYHHRLDVPGLAQATGLCQWRIRRHLRPVVFVRLPPRILQRYAEVFGMTWQQLKDHQASPS